MKKTFIQKTTLFIFALLLSNALLAATVTWTGAGSNNRWSTRANWDTGSVPNSSDDVVIPSGSGLVRFNPTIRRAQSVFIGTGSTLRILNNKRLRLINTGVPIAIHNEGTLDVRGILELENSTSMGILNDGTLLNFGLITVENQGLFGILNDGLIENEVSGRIEFLNGGSSEALATVNGGLLNEGEIVFLAGGDGRGISIGEDFENTSTSAIVFEDGNRGRMLMDANSLTNNGLIRFENSPHTSYLIYLQGGTTLVNGRSGRMEIEGSTSLGGLGIAGNSVFRNEGYLNFSGFTTNQSSAISAINRSRLINAEGATLLLETDHKGIDVAGSFTNFGDCTILGASQGLFIRGDVVNYSGGNMNIEEATIGIEISTYGGFYNKSGSIFFNDISFSDIRNEGIFQNLYCAFVEGDNRIVNNGTFENSAWMSYLTFGNGHIGNSLIVNTGIVIDPYDRFVGAIDNQEVRVTALVNPQVNVPYSNAFDIANITTSFIGDFYVDLGLTIPAGAYDYNTNTYTLKNAAIGATRLYAKASQNCTRVLEIRVVGSVQPITNNQPEENLMFRESNASDTELKWTVFPNPTSGIFQVQLPASDATTYELQVLNAQGQLIARQVGQMAFENYLSFDLSESPAGMYWTHLLQDGQMVAQKKMVLTK